jgi:heavy-metal resistance protein CzcE
MENIVKLFAPVLAAVTLSAASLSANALTPGDLYGEPAAPEYAPERTIVVTPQTKAINVTRGEVVTLRVGSKEFAWDFDGLARPFDLSKIAPEGTLDHRVTVYVGSSLQDGGFGD